MLNSGNLCHESIHFCSFCYGISELTWAWMASILLNFHDNWSLVTHILQLVLELSYIFVGVQWYNTVVVVSRHYQHSWIQLGSYCVQRRVIDEIVHSSFFRWAILISPHESSCELLVTKHVGNWHLTNNTSKQVRHLVGNGCDQSSTIWTTLNKEMVWICPALGSKILSCTNEIIKCILSFLLYCLLMPVVSKLTTSTNIGHNMDSIEIIDKRQDCWVELRLRRHAKPTISIQVGDHWSFGVARAYWLESLFPSSDKHWDFGSILASEPDLVGYIVIWRTVVAWNLNFLNKLRFKCIQVQAIGLTGNHKRLKGVENTLVLLGISMRAYSSKTW